MVRLLVVFLKLGAMVARDIREVAEALADFH
jgi:hypothetical protein